MDRLLRRGRPLSNAFIVTKMAVLNHGLRGPLLSNLPSSIGMNVENEPTE